MFYTYAEKQGNVLFDGWQMRQIAFDTMRRYMYYSTGNLKESQIGYTFFEDNPKPITMGSATSATSRSHSAHGSPTFSVNSQRCFAEVPAHSVLYNNVHWRRKMKVDLIVQVAKEHEFYLDDVHLRENDFFQVEIQGESRHLQSGEAPAPGPLLCPSTGLSSRSGRCDTANDEYIRDPFSLRELYESMRDQFTNMRLERECTQMHTGQPPNPRFAHIQTIQSPRAKGEPLFKGSRVAAVFRFRNEYEYRRFCFVAQSVLGYDKLNVRPYRGLPPYDPRNGIIFAQIPMSIWHTFKSLDKAVIYTFLRGDLLGRTLDGQPTVFLHGAYICITHDTILIFRDTGNIPRWLKMQDVREFHYSTVSHKPFFAFISDPGGIDIVFVPQPPVYGPEAIRRFSPQMEIVRVCYVVREMCFASLAIRRVINIKESNVTTVRAFIGQYEVETGERLKFDPEPGSASALSCPMPKEQLANVWHEVQSIYATRDRNLVNQSAIPIYNNNTNDAELTAEQVETLSRRLERERVAQNDVVGIPYSEARQVRPRHHVPRVRSNTSTSANDSDGRRWALNIGERQGASYPVVLSGSHSFSSSSSDSSSSLANDKVASSVLYSVPGARYITTEEVANGMELPSGEIFVDHHSILMSQTPMASGAVPPVLHSEINVDQLMSRSIDAMRGLAPPPHPLPHGNDLGGGTAQLAASPSKNTTKIAKERKSARLLRKQCSSNATHKAAKSSAIHSIET